MSRRRRVLLAEDELTVPGLNKEGNEKVIIHAYELYAVERWIVDRSALLRLLVVYTADPAHSVQLHVYHSDDLTLHTLAAQSGARLKHTPDGILILTSLARFRSDYTIVPIPNGRFSLPVQSNLYSRINLLRLGSSGRTALTLAEPSESTNERFVSTYRTNPSLVLTLVALVQSALAIFGYPLYTDGLLCNDTVHAISEWSIVFANPSDRTLDPSFISAILSLVLSIQNKLAHLGYSHLLPTDPFSSPLSPALAAYSHNPPSTFIPLTNHLVHSINASFDSKRLSRVIRSKLHSTDSLLVPILDLPTFVSIVSSTPDLAPPSLTTIWSLSDLPKHTTHKQSHRGGIASDGDNPLNRSTEDESSLFHWPTPKVNLRPWAGLTKRKHQSVDLTPTVLPPTDRPLPALPQFTGPRPNTRALTLNTTIPRHRPSRRSTVGPIGSGSKAPSFFSIRAQSPTLSPLHTSFFGEGDDDDLLSSGQISPLTDTRPNPFPFSLGRPSAAHGNHHLHPSSYQPSGARTATMNQTPNIDGKTLARLLLDKGKKRTDNNDTSGGGRIASWAGPLSVNARGWTGSGSDSDEIPLQNNIFKGQSATASLVPPKDWGKEKARFDSLVKVVDAQGRLIEEEMDSEDSSGVQEYRTGRFEEEMVDSDESSDEIDEERKEIVKRRAARGVAKGELSRRRSFHDLDTFRELQVLSPKRMKIDVELCGQCLIMWRRETHLRNVVDCVRLITSTLSKSNTHLRAHSQSHLPTLMANYASANVSNPSSNTSRSTSPQPQKFSTPPLLSSSPPLFSPLPSHTSPTHIFQSIDEASLQTERFSQATNTLRYESEQFDVGGLWSWVGRERRKVWALRGGVFGEGNGGGRRGHDNSDDNKGVEVGVGRKLPEGVHGAHGLFNRLQWRLDGQSVLVDELGRTESEAEEDDRLERGADVDRVTDSATGSHEGDEGPADKPNAQKEDEEIEVGFLDRQLGIKPMWLLKFFTSWGARWSAGATGNAIGGVDGNTMVNEVDETADQGQRQDVDVNGKENLAGSRKANEPHLGASIDVQLD